MTTKDDAFLPEYLKSGCLGKDYQRIANEARDSGTTLHWNHGYPSLDEAGTFDMSFMFLYPQVIHAFNISP